MRKIRFGRTNVQVPAVSLGTWGPGGPNVNNGVSVGWTGLRAQAERSLRNMRTDVIDLYYCHHCDFGSRLDDVLEVMHRLREEGKVCFVGVSDWDATKIMQYIERVDPETTTANRAA